MSWPMLIALWLARTLHLLRVRGGSWAGVSA
jgi:hypothetical protein